MPSSATATQKYCSPKCARTAHRHSGYSVKDKIVRKKTLNRHDRYGLYITYAQECALCGFTTRNSRTIGTLFNVYFHGNGFVNCLPKQFREQAKKELEQANGGCELHHIVPICDGGDSGPDNIILLCPNCHKAVHQGLVSRETLLSKIQHYKPEELMNALAEVLFKD